MEVLNTTQHNVQYRLLNPEGLSTLDLRPLAAGVEEMVPETWRVEFYIGGRIVADALVSDPRAVVRLVEAGRGYAVEVISSREPLVSHRIDSSRLIESMLPAAVPSAPAVLQARRNALAREELFKEFGAYTSAEVADLAGSKASNKAALANRWKQEGRIFSVTHHGATYFPAFQFDDQGRPRPVLAQVIASLGSKSTEWELALWFMGNTGWLDGKRPVDLLESDPNAVAEAAASEAEDLYY
ncbi:MAG TPA: hypothetical protein VH988_20990 [Thermoanaerobaculia bacterium]|nr:hypothetical protein [Thermoanaerobaculia bacterium]